MTRILVLAGTSAITQRISALPGHDVAAVDREVVEKYVRAADIESLLKGDSGTPPEIVVLGDAMSVQEALSLGAMIDRVVPGSELMLISEPDADTVLSAMRAGVREIISQEMTDDELAMLFHRAADNVSNRLKPHLSPNIPADISQSTVVVVISAKGGVGKSTIASNLAVGLARRAPMETVLVDLDIQFGDVATLLDLAPAHSIADAFGTSAAMDTLILKTFLTLHPGGFYVLAGDDSPTVGDHVLSSDVEHLLDQLASQFRYVVVDTGAGLGEHTLAALERADDVVVVSSMDVTSIRAVRKELDVLGELNLLPDRRHLVLNFSDRNAGLTVRDVENVIGAPVSVVVPRSSDVTVAGNRGESLMMAKKLGSVAKAIVKLVDAIVVDVPMVLDPPKSKDSKKRRGRRKS
jgi:pilus assembly protein CpaE